MCESNSFAAKRRRCSVLVPVFDLNHESRRFLQQTGPRAFSLELNTRICAIHGDGKARHIRCFAGSGTQIAGKCDYLCGRQTFDIERLMPRQGLTTPFHCLPIEFATQCNVRLRHLEIRCFAFVLRDRRNIAGQIVRQGISNQPPCGFRQFNPVFFAVSVSWKYNRSCGNDVACVQSVRHQVQSHGGIGLYGAVQNHRFDRSRSAVSGKRRRMQIDRTLC